MKRCTSYILVALLMTQACKKENKSPVDPSIAGKYARFGAPVYKEKEMRTWLTTLGKAEYVDLLEMTEVRIKNRSRAVARVRLSDYSEGYMNPEHLADKPIVFLEDTKAHKSSDLQSPVYMTVPKGTIAFVIAEKGDWSQVYAGRVLDRNLASQWVRGGFSADRALIAEAREYEEAVAGLETDESTDETRIQAIKKLNDLAASSRAFGDLARKKIIEDTARSGERTPPEENTMGTAEEKAD